MVPSIAMNSDNDAKHSSGPDGASTAKPATKIRIIEDADATGETAAVYDFWRAGSGRHQVPGIIKCFGARPDFLCGVIDLRWMKNRSQRRYTSQPCSLSSIASPTRLVFLLRTTSQPGN
jgi:hypothetical protein